MATFTVTTAADVVNPGDGALSLREAVRQANGTAAADRIVFADALEGRTLVLAQGQLDLAADVTVDGDRDDDGAEVTLSGGDASRVLAVSGSGTDVALADLTIADGNSDDLSGLLDFGAGIRANAGVGLTLNGCTLRDNGGYINGGALFAAAGSEVAVERCMIVGNRAYDGGGIFFEGARLSVNASYIGRNRAADLSSSGNSGEGGGIAVAAGVATITGSTIAGNSSGYVGGGVSVRGATVSVANSTVAGNTAFGSIYGRGGGLYSDGDLSLTNATVTGNVAYSVDVSAQNAVGGGVLSTGALSIGNSIVAANFSNYQRVSSTRRSDDVDGGITASNGHNIFGSAVDGNVPGDLENVAAARLFAALDPDTDGGRLAPNGGPTPTVRLRDAFGNPALSGADPLDSSAEDQRGVDRPLPPISNPDVGSFELDQRQVSRGPSGGNDVLTGTVNADTFAALQGNDLVRGLGGSDTLRGLSGSDTLDGGPGADLLNGGSASDLLRGGEGGDLLRGGAHQDTLLGGGGGDRFDVDPGDSGVGPNRRDLVLDFARGADRIDVAAIDAVAGGADDTFAFVGRQAFTAAGQIRFTRVGDDTVVQGSTDADRAAEFEIELGGALTLGAGDFVL